MTDCQLSTMIQDWCVPGGGECGQERWLQPTAVLLGHRAETRTSLHSSHHHSFSSSSPCAHPTTWLILINTTHKNVVNVMLDNNLSIYKLLIKGNFHKENCCCWSSWSTMSVSCHYCSIHQLDSSLNSVW